MYKYIPHFTVNGIHPYKNGQHVQCDPQLIDYIDQKKIIQTEGDCFTRYINHIIS